MRKEQAKSREETHHEPQHNHLVVGDLIHYLSHLAKLHGDDKTGNPKLREGLQELVKVLRPYTRRSILDLAGALREPKRPCRHGSSSGRAKESLPADLETIPCDRIENIINRKYSKVQLVELGVRRFGISQSKLVSLDRDGVLASIRSALDHERSLDVISREARRGG